MGVRLGQGVYSQQIVDVVKRNDSMDGAIRDAIFRESHFLAGLVHREGDLPDDIKAWILDCADRLLISANEIPQAWREAAPGRRRAADGVEGGAGAPSCGPRRGACIRSRAGGAA